MRRDGRKNLALGSARFFTKNLESAAPPARKARYLSIIQSINVSKRSQIPTSQQPDKDLV